MSRTACIIPMWRKSMSSWALRKSQNPGSSSPTPLHRSISLPSKSISNHWLVRLHTLISRPFSIPAQTMISRVKSALKSPTSNYPSPRPTLITCPLAPLPNDTSKGVQAMHHVKSCGEGSMFKSPHIQCPATTSSISQTAYDRSYVSPK